MPILRNPIPGQSPPSQPPLPAGSDHYAAPLLQLGRALLALGMPAHRVEGALGVMAARLGLSAQFYSTPTALFIALGEGREQHTYLARVAPGGADLGKIAEITEIMEQLADRRLEPEQATRRVQEIYLSPPRYGRLATFIGFPLVAVPATVLLGGHLKEIVLGTVLSAVVGLLAIGTAGRAAERIFIPLSAMLVALGAGWGAVLAGDIAFAPALLGGLIVLLPGLDITTATRELATGHLVSGGARLAGAGLVLLMLVFGLALGKALASWIAGPPPVVSPPAVPWWILPPLILLAASGFLLLFRIRRRQWVWVAISCLVAWSSALVTGDILGRPLGAFSGALLVGLAGNAYANRSGQPSSILHIPGLMLLVPGSIGLRGMAALLDADVASGVEGVFFALLTAVAMTTGLLLASVLLPPRQEL